MKYTKDELIKKITFHEERADYYAIKLQELLANNQIGFKYNNKDKKIKK